MPGIIPVSPKLAFANAAGGPLANGTLTVYLAGTTTLTPTWQDEGQTTLNTNPIVLDARGECLVWLDPTLNYKFLLKDDTGATIWTVDDINGVPTDASGITYTPAGGTAVATTVQSKLREQISIFDFMSAAQIADVVGGTSAIDVTVPWQNAIAYIQSLKNRPTLLVPPYKYRISSTLYITADSVAIFGLGMPSVARGDDSSSITRGPTLRYYGTGTALVIGIAPDVNGDFIYETNIQNLRIELDDNATSGMRVWHSAVCYFRNISIFGNKGANRYGLQVNGGISTIYEQIFINGQGQTSAMVATDFVNAGLRLELGFANDVATTTVFRRCYITSCNKGVLMNYRFDFEDCVFESNDVGVESVSYMVSNFHRCWWEANVTRDIVFSGGADGDTAIISDSNINSGSRQTFFSIGNGCQQIAIRGCQIASNNANPVLFLTGTTVVRTSSPVGLLTLDNNRFATNTIFGGTEGSTSSGYPLVQNNNQKLVVYRFVQKAITSGFTGLMDTGEGIAGDAYLLSRAGNAVAIYAWYTGSIGAGNYSFEPKINGTNIASLVLAGLTTEPVFHPCDPMRNTFATGDSLTLGLTTSGFSGGDFIVEVHVLHGGNGRP